MIHAADGLTDDEGARLLSLVRSEFSAASPVDLMRAVGFAVVHDVDVTAQFRATAAEILQARCASETALRAREGNQVYDEEQAKKRGIIEAIDAGLLVRSFIVATKP